MIALIDFVNDTKGDVEQAHALIQRFRSSFPPTTQTKTIENSLDFYEKHGPETMLQAHVRSYIYESSHGYLREFRFDAATEAKKVKKMINQYFTYFHALQFYLSDTGNCAPRAAYAAIQLRNILPEDYNVALRSSKSKDHFIVFIFKKGEDTLIYDPYSDPLYLHEHKAYEKEIFLEIPQGIPGRTHGYKLPSDTNEEFDQFLKNYVTGQSPTFSTAEGNYCAHIRTNFLLKNELALLDIATESKLQALFKEAMQNIKSRFAQLKSKLLQEKVQSSSSSAAAFFSEQDGEVGEHSEKPETKKLKP